MPLLLDRSHLAPLAEEHRAAYAAAEPFPHVVLDDFLPAAALDDVLGEFPAAGARQWLRFDSPLEKKLATIDDTLMGPATRQVLAQLNSATMIDFLRDLTGIDGLVPDPHYVGGGLHQIEPGGFLEVHADFNLHPLTGLYRRLNLLLYLNRGWGESWGGALELWDRSMSTCAKRVLPLFNRCVIFSTTDHAFHGHPEPVACPDGTTRKSLALYYYAREPDPADTSPAPHNTLFQQREAEGGARRTIMHDVAPPIVLRGMRRLRDRLRPPPR